MSQTNERHKDELTVEDLTAKGVPVDAASEEVAAAMVDAGMCIDEDADPEDELLDEHGNPVNPQMDGTDTGETGAQEEAVLGENGGSEPTEPIPVDMQEESAASESGDDKAGTATEEDADHDKSDESDTGSNAADAQSETSQAGPAPQHARRKRTTTKAVKKPDASAATEGTGSATTKSTRRRRTATVEPNELNQRTEAMVESAHSEDKLSLAERREAARAEAANSNSAIARDAATARSHAEVMRMSRARQEQRMEDREALLTIFTSWANIIRAKEQHRYIMGEVVAIEEIKKTIVVVLNVEGFRTLIPFNNFFVHDPIDYSTAFSERELRTRQTQILTSYIGLQTPLMITDYVANNERPEDSVALGNRREALLMMQEQFFTGRNALQEGDIVDGYIISVGMHSLRILVGGVEAFVPKFRATLRYTATMADRFCINQSRKVLIRKIIRQKDGTIDLQLDGTVDDRETMRDNLRLVRMNSRYVGRIIAIHKRRSDLALIYHLHLEQQDIHAVATGTPTSFDNHPLAVGDAVVFLSVFVDIPRGIAGGRVIQRFFSKFENNSDLIAPDGHGLRMPYPKKYNIQKGGN